MLSKYDDSEKFVDVVANSDVCPELDKIFYLVHNLAGEGDDSLVTGFAWVFNRVDDADGLDLSFLHDLRFLFLYPRMTFEMSLSSSTTGKSGGQ